MQTSLSILLESDDSDELLAATKNISQLLQLEHTIPQECLQRISENLGDDLPALRKASHQFFQQYIRNNQSFQKVLQAFTSIGLIHSNVCVRQKNCNSLQSLLISESKYINWTCPEMFVIHEQLCKRMQDSHQVVQKAAEETMTTLIKNEGYGDFYQKLPWGQQDQIRKFIEQQKLRNVFAFDFQLSAEAQTVYQIPPSQRNKYVGHHTSRESQQLGNVQSNKPRRNSQTSTSICPPFDQQDFDNLKDPSFQNRLDGIAGIQHVMDSQNGKICYQFTPLQLRSLLGKIIDSTQDHNFKVVITTLEIINQIVQVESFIDEERHLFQIISRACDPKQAIRVAIMNVLVNYLGRVSDDELLQGLIETVKGNSQQDEVLELSIELCRRNRLLIQNNMRILLNHVAPLIEDSRTNVNHY